MKATRRLGMKADVKLATSIIAIVVLVIMVDDLRDMRCDTTWATAKRQQAMTMTAAPETCPDLLDHHDGLRLPDIPTSFDWIMRRLSEWTSPSLVPSLVEMVKAAWLESWTGCGCACM